VVVKSADGGRKFSNPGLARALTNGRGKKKGLDPERYFEHRGQGPAGVDEEVAEFDQATGSIKNSDGTDGPISFRSNAFATMTVDGQGRLYMAWSERGFATGAGRPSAVDGDARIVMSTSTDGLTWSAPRAVANGAAGHQLMPSLTFGGGKLVLVYYDLREDRSGIFAPFIKDRDVLNLPTLPRSRHTLDLRASYGTPGATPTFAPSVQVSDYLTRVESGQLKQMQYNAPNLPMFKQGTAPFMGDYVDVTVAPAFVPTSKGGWKYNTDGPLPVFHAVWTDNRDVRQPKDYDGDRNPWNDYRAPTPRTESRLDGSTLPSCDPNLPNTNTGSRDQNIYTARLTTGLVVGSPGNAKPLSTTLQRAFVVFAQNVTPAYKAFRLDIVSQPPGGRASFDQFNPVLTSIDVTTPPRSTASRSVYVTSSDPDAQVRVTVTEIASAGGAVVSGGLSDVVILNPDIENPDIENPDIENPDIENPDIENAEVYNPDIENPDVSNPDIENPDIENPDIENPDIENPDIENPDIENPDIENVTVANPDIENPDIENPDIENPDIENPDIENPDIENPDIENQALTDVTWTMTNDGNTTSAFNVNLFLAQQTDKICAPGDDPNAAGCIGTQLILHKVYTTPTAVGCTLQVQSRNVVIANIPNPRFVAPGTSLPPQNDSSAENATLWLAPGEVGKITLRIYDRNKADNKTVNDSNGSTPSAGSIDAVFLPTTTTDFGSVTPVVRQQSVDTEDKNEGSTTPPIVTPLSPAVPPADESTPLTLTFVQEPPLTVAAGNTFPVGVEVKDQYGALVTLFPEPGANTLTVSGNTAAADGNGVATFLTVLVSPAGSNYRLVATSGTALPVLSRAFSVALTSVSVTLSGSPVTYDGTPKSVTATTLPVPNLAVNVTYDGSTALPVNAGSYAVVATVADPNYSGGTSGTFVIAQRPASVTPDVASKIEGTPDPVLTGALAGFLPGDNVTATYSRTPGELPGTYTISGAATPAGVLPNYNITYATADFTIIPAGPTCAPFQVTNTNDSGPCSLRQAILDANATPSSDTITFAIPGPGPHAIVLGSPLPNITQPAVIDAETQPGYNAAAGPAVEVSAGLSGAQYGLSVYAGNSTIRGLAVTGFQEAGVWAFQFLNAITIERNTIGTDAAGNPKGNRIGVQMRYISNSTIQDNVIAGNSDSAILLEGGVGNTVRRNTIGLVQAGMVGLPNGNSGIRMYYDASNTTIEDNRIAASEGWAIDVQYGTQEVTGTQIRHNTIGLKADGTSLANEAGGVRLQQAPGTVVDGGNVISGNYDSTANTGGPGIQVEGFADPAPAIRGNYIGTDPTGMMARPNKYEGIRLFGPALVGGDQPGEGNLISGNGVAAIGAGAGIVVFQGTDGTVIAGNTIGLNAAGAPLGNGYSGITIVDGASNVRIGGTTAAERNVISGNAQPGIAIYKQYAGAPAPSSITVQGNAIGTDAAGTAAVGNGLWGVYLQGGTNITIGGQAPGAGNIITHNNYNGVYVGPGSSAVSILSNSIDANSGLGIDVDPLWISGAPSLSNVTPASFDFAVPLGAGAYTLEVFSSPACDPSGYGEGRTLLGSFVTAGPSGTIAASYPAGTTLTLTATNASGTSEFSNCATVPAAPVSVTVVLSNLSQTYDGSPKPVNVGTTPSVGYSVTYNGVATVPSGAGSYLVVATVTEPGYTGSDTGTLVISKATATVALSNLAQTYTGSPLTPTATTTPGGLGVVWTGAPQTAAGSYPVTATVNDPNYEGSDSGTFVISAPAPIGATISISNTSAIYSGSGQAVTITTGPLNNLAHVVTYNGLGTVPSAIGAYNVSATITEPGYTPANATATHVIASTARAGGQGGSGYGPLSCGPGVFAKGFRVALNGPPNTPTPLYPWDYIEYALTSGQLLCSDANNPVKFGGGTTPNSDLACPSGKVMVGMAGSTGGPGWNIVTGVAPRCLAAGDLSPTQPWAALPANGGFPFQIDCPWGEAVTGVVGGQGAVVDSIALVCSPLPSGGSITSVTPQPAGVAFVQAVTVVGTGLPFSSDLPGTYPPAIAQQVVITKGGVDYPAVEVHLATASKWIFMLPQAFTSGPATIRLRNAEGTTTTNAFNITVSATPSAPVIQHVFQGTPAGGFTTTPVTSLTPGAWLTVESDGVSMSANTATYVFTPQSGAGNAKTATGTYGNVGGVSGGIRHTVQIPADLDVSGWVDVQVYLLGPSPLSNAVRFNPGPTITSVTPSSGATDQWLVARGTLLPTWDGNNFATIPQVTISNGTTTAAATYLPSASNGSVAYFALPAGFPLGAATVTLSQGATVTNSFPITVASVPGTPVITGVFSDGGGLSPITSFSVGQTIYVRADGIRGLSDLRFEQGANTWTVDNGFNGTSGQNGVFARFVVPAGPAVDPITISIRHRLDYASTPSAFSAPLTGLNIQ
jgi:hypothetical protein